MLKADVSITSRVQLTQSKKQVRVDCGRSLFRAILVFNSFNKNAYQVMKVENLPTLKLLFYRKNNNLVQLRLDIMMYHQTRILPIARQTAYILDLDLKNVGNSIPRREDNTTRQGAFSAAVVGMVITLI